MSDIVRRLREFTASITAFKDADLPKYVVLIDEAADQIERLEAMLTDQQRDMV